MNFKKIFKTLSILCGTSIVALPFISANTSRYKNYVNQKYSYYFDKLNLLDDIHNQDQYQNKPIGIIDSQYVDYETFNNKIKYKNQNIFYMNPNVLTENKITQKPSDFFIRGEHTMERITNDDKKSQGILDGSEHPNTIADMMTGKNGISKKSDIYSARYLINYNELKGNKWYAYQKEQNKQLVKILNGFLVNDVKTVNISLGNKAIFHQFYLYEFYPRLEAFTKFIEKSEQNLWNNDNEYWKQLLITNSIIDKDITNNSINFKELALYYLVAYEYIFKDNNTGTEMFNFWKTYMDYDFADAQLFITKYDINITSKYKFPNELIESFNQNTTDYKLKFFEQIATYFVKYIWTNIFEEKSEFNSIIFNKKLNDFYRDNFLFNSFSSIIDSYASRYNIKFVISAGNSEEFLSVMRFIANTLKKNNIKNKFIDTNYDILNHHQPNKNSKNAIYVGAIAPFGYTTRYSTQGEAKRDDYPLVVAPGKYNPDLKLIYEKGISTEFSGTSFAAPMLSGFINLLERKLGRTLSVAELKATLASNSRHLSPYNNGTYYYFENDNDTFNGAEYEAIHENNALHLSGYGTPDFKKVFNSLKNTKSTQIKLKKYEDNLYVTHKVFENKVIAHNENIQLHDAQKNKSENIALSLNENDIEEIFKFFEENTTYDKLFIPILDLINISKFGNKLNNIKVSIAWNNNMTKSFWNNLKENNISLRDDFIESINIFDLQIETKFGIKKELQTKPLYSDGRNSVVEQIYLTKDLIDRYLSVPKIYLVVNKPKISDQNLKAFKQLMINYFKTNKIYLSSEVTVYENK
ncbi:S8 family serine peptidase [Mycoplasmopsis verecunda]|uniref:Subtilase family protein n=1 Tax=Mycoplasmopsis verecunda TaxID=171291 RepID=A0A1T4M583_9BACT|nr:S8 family serine peptidase [Mycoplasmopsis verecunda]WPB54366.1 S8 family serine peptidase [Mycoplasmopsis verecunda]SJZ62071.1 Subtilase family protein [Mycoplasmopsis verecunda]